MNLSNISQEITNMGFQNQSWQMLFIGGVYVIAGISFCTLNIVGTIPLLLAKTAHLPHQLIILHIVIASLLRLIVVPLIEGVYILMNVEVNISK